MNDTLSSSKNTDDLTGWLATAAPFILIVVTFIAYASAIQGGYIWDDDSHVWNNPHLFEDGGLFRIWFTKESQQYYPLVYSSFWFEWQLWGAKAAGYHAVNVVLHSFNAIMLWRILRYLGFKWAFVAAVVFALHPVNVESVAWVSERKNVLSGLFYLTSLLCYLKFDDSGLRKFYTLALFTFLLALLSKTVVCSLPAVLVILHWMRGRPLTVRRTLPLVPMFVIGGAMGLLTVWWEATQVGASGIEWQMTIAERLMLPARIAWFYASKIFVPYNLTFIYPRFTPDPSSAFQWLFIIALLVLGAVLWFKKKSITRAPAAALAFFLVTLFPALGFIDVYPFRYSFVADHFQYLACIAPISVGVGLIWFFLEKGGRAGLKPVAVVALVVVLGILTWNQGHMYKDEETLWRETLRRNPDAWIAHTNLGIIEYSRGDLDIAMGYYQRAVELWPNSREATYNLGSSLLEKGRLEEAERHLRKAVELRPDFAAALSKLGVTLSYMGRHEEAYKYAFDAVIKEPGNSQMQNDIGTVLLRAGRYEEAVTHYKNAIAIDPSIYQAYNNVGVALSETGDVGGALIYFNEATRINPSYAEGYYNAGVTLEDAGRKEEAIERYKKAITENPSHYKAFNNLGEVLFSLGEYSLAADAFKRALELAPNFTKARDNLKRAQGRLGAEGSE